MVPAVAPEVALEAVPAVALEVVPAAVLEAVPEVALEAVPEVVPEVVLEAVPEAVEEGVAITPTTAALSGTPRRAASATTATIPTITRVSLVAELGARAVLTLLVRSLAAVRITTTR